MSPEEIEKLPRGIWVEKERRRIRVRVYRQSRVIYQEYFNLDEVNEAIAAHKAAKQKQKDLRKRVHHVATTLHGQIEQLQDVMT